MYLYVTQLLCVVIQVPYRDLRLRDMSCEKAAKFVSDISLLLLCSAANNFEEIANKQAFE